MVLLELESLYLVGAILGPCVPYNVALGMRVWLSMRSFGVTGF